MFHHLCIKTASRKVWKGKNVKGKKELKEKSLQKKKEKKPKKN